MPWIEAASSVAPSGISPTAAAQQRGVYDRFPQAARDAEDLHLVSAFAEGAPTIGMTTVRLGDAIKFRLRLEYARIRGQHRLGAIAGPGTRRFVPFD